jgi:hypothetical protein
MMAIENKSYFVKHHILEVDKFGARVPNYRVFFGLHWVYIKPLPNIPAGELFRLNPNLLE